MDVVNLDYVPHRVSYSSILNDLINIYTMLYTVFILLLQTVNTEIKIHEIFIFLRLVIEQ